MRTEFVGRWSVFYSGVAGLFLAGGIVACAQDRPQWRIRHPVFKPDLDVAEKDVAPYMSMSERQLRGLLSTDGGRGVNKKMKTVVYDMARLYHKTGDAAYADKAVILLERFAEVVPKWPLISRRDSRGRRKGDLIPLDQVDWSSWDCSGLWGAWYCLDLKKSRELVLAYDLVADSGAVERRSRAMKKNVRERIETNLLRYLADLSLRFDENPFKVGRIAGEDFSYDNMGAQYLTSLVPFGRVVEPAYIHITVRRLRNYPRVGYFRDGIWHESAPSYHRQITGRLKQAISALSGYSDPAGYRYTGYNTRPIATQSGKVLAGKEFRGDGTRFDDLDVEAGIERQFERTREALQHLVLPNGEYLAVHDTHAYERTLPPARSDSHCYFGMRHAVLGRFSGEDQAQIHLHFGGTDGHEHGDCLNLVLWALGGELLSEGEYKKYGNRGWNISTAGHNTVVVDEESQKSRLHGGACRLTEDDAVDGVGFFRYQDYGHGNTKHFGNLKLWDPTHPNIQVVEAEGENAYGKEKTSLYRRTLAMVEIEGKDFYLIDVFRVKGGTTHDWMLHGRLNEDYEVWTDLALGPASGKRFESWGAPHLDVQNKTVTDSTWSSEFISESGARIRTTMLGFPGTEVAIGRAPAMRREGEATFLDVRRLGGDSLFVCVHEPYGIRPRIRRVTPLLYTGKAASVVCFKVELEGGRTDFFASSLDKPPYREYTVPGEGLRFAGRLIHVSEAKGETRWMYLLEGGFVREGAIAAPSPRRRILPYRGHLADVKRVEKGDSWNGFVTRENLPVDGALAHRTPLLTLGDGRTEGYTISRIVREGKLCQIHVNEEPGLELRDGDLAKLVYYPWHGVRGGIRFFISGSAYGGRSSKIEVTGLATEE